MRFARAEELLNGARAIGVVVDPTPPAPGDYMANFHAVKTGYGKGVTAGIDSSYTVVMVTNNATTNIPGSLIAALNTGGKTWVQFAAGVGDLKPSDGSRPQYHLNDDTVLDGHGWTGTIYGGVDASNTNNVVVMYLSVTQPFPYGGNPSGPCIGMSNCQMGYVYHCNIWDSGDVLMTGGAYQLTPGHLTDKTAPYAYTVDGCRIGPNPGEYAIMSPIIGSHPGYSPGALNGINNDARNGKAVEAAYDHNWIEGDFKTKSVKFTSSTAFTLNSGTIVAADNGKAVFAGKDIVNPDSTIASGGTLHFVDGTHGTLSGAVYTGPLNTTMSLSYYTIGTAHPQDFAGFDHAVYITNINNVVQGCILRNGKARSQYVDFINNIVAKYGTPFNVSSGTDTSVTYGGGTAVSDNGTMNCESNVYIEYNLGEQFVGFQNAVADRNGKPHMIVTDPGAKALTTDGTGPTAGNRRLAGCWYNGAIETTAYVTGFDRTADVSATIRGYTFTFVDRSIQANAQALVTALEDTPATRAGNPFSTVQPPQLA